MADVCQATCLESHLAQSDGRLPLITGHRLVMMVVAVVERPVGVEVKVPAHTVVLSIRLYVVSGKFGVICCSVLLAIALAASVAVAVVCTWQQGAVLG